MEEEIKKFQAKAEELKDKKDDSPVVQIFKKNLYRFVKSNWPHYISILDEISWGRSQVFIGEYEAQDEHVEMMDNIIEFLENIKEEPVTLNSAIEEKPNQKQRQPSSNNSAVVQNFYINQSQVQTIKNELDISAYNEEIKAKFEELLTELSKKDNRNKEHVASLIKWLADKSIDLLIAFLSRPR